VSSLVVELAGPAGAGKTTLAGALRAIDTQATVGVDVGRARLVAGIASAAPHLAAARASARGRWWTSGELRSLAYLSAWRGPLADRRPDGSVLLDHGPVFRLAALAAYGPPMATTPAFEHWWRRSAKQWARLLDVVVWLDAPDAVLLRRVAQRDRDHRLRDAGPTAADEFFARYRSAYLRTLDVLTNEGTQLVRVDTSTGAPDELAQAVRHAIAGSLARPSA
jgi:cytidylate kinase